MNVYWFDVEVAGPVGDEHVEALGDRLAAAEGIDATVHADDRGGVVMFSREAEDAVQAIVSAIMDVEAAGMAVTRVVEDRVTVEDIAERAGVTVTAVRYWISGGRGPGGFPRAQMERPRGSLWSWAEVSAWSVSAKVGKADHLAAETARAGALVTEALAVRRGVRELPQHERSLITGLVA